MIALVWPSLAVQTKRWHDRNRSGFWNLILFVPIAGAIWGMTELGFLKGTAGANLYGVPLGPCPASDDGAPTPPAENFYLANKLRESETVGSGSSMSNSWRGR